MPRHRPGPSSGRQGRRSWPRRAVLALAVPAIAAAVVTAPTAPAPAAATGTTALTSAVAAGGQVDTTPYLGWSSWSLEALHDRDYNPRPRSWLTAGHVLDQAAVMARRLKPFGYEYVNIDSGWWTDQDGNEEFDAAGRQRPDQDRFPDGMAAVADRIHAMGLKLGLYLPVGLAKASYDAGDLPIAGAPGCTTHDIVYDDLRITGGFDSAYKIDFDRPCAQAYVASQIDLLASWGVDFLKLDGVGPGSFKSGPNYDNTADVAAFHAAIGRATARTGRPMILELSWSLDHGEVATWQRNADGWRVGFDVECYCETLTKWDAIAQRFRDVLAWTRDAGPRKGWNDLDSLDVGSGGLDGLTDAERRTAVTLWAIEAAPLYSGDDLTRLDTYGKGLLTNREVLAVDQAGRPARPYSTSTPQQVWSARRADGTYTVALFNLGDDAATVTADWSDLRVGDRARVRDLWQHRDLGTYDDGYGVEVPAHGSVLLRVTPAR